MRMLKPVSKTGTHPAGKLPWVKRSGVAFLLPCALLISMAAGAQPGEKSSDGEMKSGEVSVIRIAARKAGLQDFKLESRLSPSGRMIISGFSATVGGGQITGRGHVDFSRPAGPHRMRVDLKDVDGTAFLRLLEVRLNARINARVNGSFDLTWKGTSSAQARRSLTGPARWHSGGGAVEGSDLQFRAAQATGIDELRRIEFTSAGAAGVFRNGVLDVERVEVVGPYQQIGGAGQLDAATRQINVQLEMKIAPELALGSSRPEIQALGLLMRRSSREGDKSRGKEPELLSLPFPVMMTGNVQDPQFTLVMPAARNSGGAAEPRK